MRRNLIIYSTACLIAASLLSYHFYNTPGEISVEKTEAEAVTRVVATTVSPQRHNISINSGGIVVAANKSLIAAQVSGQISKVLPIATPGFNVNKNDVLAVIDDRDFHLAVNQARADLATANAKLVIEEGLGELATEEFKLASELIPFKENALALREPQLEIAKQNLVKAQSTLKKAELDLERTQIKAPITASVVRKLHDVGDYVSVGTPIFELIGSQEYWLQVSLSSNEIGWINDNTTVEITHPAWPTGAFLTAKVLSKLNEVRPEDRQAEVLLSLSPAEAQEKGISLMIGQYLDVGFKTFMSEKTIRIDTPWIINGDTTWTITEDHYLKLVSINPIYKGRDYTLVDPQKFQQSLILTSSLIAATEEMRVSPIIKDSPHSQTSDAIDVGVHNNE